MEEGLSKGAAMPPIDIFRSTILHAHEDLADRLDRASGAHSTPGEPRKGYEEIDTFLAVASKHQNAVSAVLLPAVRKVVPDGGHVVHDYLRAARRLEVALAHTKAREYGSVFDAGRPWRVVWADVREALATHRVAEFKMAELLASHLDARALDELAHRLHRGEKAAGTRPHPYTPHTGLPGLVARKVMHAVDAFWDAAEGRMVPEPARPPHGSPGRLTQYLLADPRFEERTPEP